MNLNEIRVQKPSRVMFETIEISHQSFATFRLVNEQVREKTLGGQIYSPAIFKYTQSQQSNTPIIDAKLSFPRLAKEFNNEINKLHNSNYALIPVTCIYRVFDSLNTALPIMQEQLYIKSVNFDFENVSLDLSMINPINERVAEVYKTEEWTGLTLS